MENSKRKSSINVINDEINYTELIDIVDDANGNDLAERPVSKNIKGHNQNNKAVNQLRNQCGTSGSQPDMFTSCQRFYPMKCMGI